jgi:hypothetical protein
MFFNGEDLKEIIYKSEARKWFKALPLSPEDQDLEGSSLLSKLSMGYSEGHTAQRTTARKSMRGRMSRGVARI